MKTNLIRKLEKQCWSHTIDGVLIDGHLHFDTKKFAELIIEECIEAARTVGGNAGVEVETIIRNRFGVEE